MQILSTIRAALGHSRARTRFAPGVTGRLHMGHVANAIFVWGIARALSGEVVLRLEDHARDRWKRETEEHILDDLEKLGFLPDLGKFEQFRIPGPCPYRQSDSTEHYEVAIERLREKFNVYACDCTFGNGTGSWHGYYDGRCRKRGLAWRLGRRLRVELPDDLIAFEDAIRGSQSQRPSEVKGDPELRNPIGNWTYRFAVVVDDNRHSINLVVRGKGLVDATATQILLARMLGWNAPSVWVHHDEIIDSATGTKLSKRRGAPSVGEMMDQGVHPWVLLGKAAAAVSLIKDQHAIKAEELAQLFS